MNPICGCPIIMYSVLFGFAHSLFIHIHSELLLNSLWAFVKRTSMLLNVHVICVLSVYMLAFETSKHFSNSFR